MKTLNGIAVIVAVPIIALAGIAIVVAAASLLLVQSASATTDVMTTTSSVGGEEQEAASSTNTTTNNNVSNAPLGNLFQIVEFETSTITPINETYIEISTENRVTVIPPNATAGTTINATETTNATLIFYLTVLQFPKGKAFL